MDYFGGIAGWMQWAECFVGGDGQLQYTSFHYSCDDSREPGKVSAFLSRLKISPADDSDDGKWVLLDTLEYQSDLAGKTFLVPAGFHTDLASIPRIPFVFEAFAGHADTAASLHDWLYTSHEVPRDVADGVLKEACLVTGVSHWRARLIWLGVRAGGGGYWKEE